MDWARYTKDLRRARGILTQAELAEMVGVDPVTVSRWETGRREPDIIHRRHLLTLARSRDGKADRAIIDMVRRAPGSALLLELDFDRAIAASPELCRLQGLTHPEFLGTRWRSNVSETVQTIIETPSLGSMLQSREIIAISWQAMAPSVNGPPYPVRAVYSPLWFSSGELVMHVGISVMPEQKSTGSSIQFVAGEEV